MKLGEVAKKAKKIMGVAGEVIDFAGDVIVGKSILTGEVAAKGKEGGEKIPPIERLRARFADIGRGDETIIAHLLGKLPDKDRAIFLGFKIWLAGKDKIKYFILRRHLTFLYSKSEKEAIETILDIVSKLEAGGNEATLEYCDAIEVTYDSTIALLQGIAPFTKNTLAKLDQLTGCAANGQMGPAMTEVDNVVRRFCNWLSGTQPQNQNKRRNK